MVDAVSVSKLPRKSAYSLEDVADLVMEVHSCVHQVGEKVDAHRLEVTQELGAVRERVAKIEGRQEAIGQRLGVDERAVARGAPQPRAWFPKPWQVIAAICAAAGGFVTIYKIAAVVLPAFNAAVLAQH